MLKAKPIPPTFRPSQVRRLVKAGKMPDSIQGGIFRCRLCGRKLPGATELPTFHSNGGYVGCRHCKAQVLYVAEFPACKGYPDGFRIDCSGERKVYPPTLTVLRKEKPELEAVDRALRGLSRGKIAEALREATKGKPLIHIIEALERRKPSAET